MARDARQMDPATLLCERCGYVIEGLDEGGACPECGKPIAESVPERRTGVPIEPDADGKVSWWRGAWAVLWRPGKTFGGMRIEARNADAFASQTSLRLALFLAAAVATVALVSSQPPSSREPWGEFALRAALAAVSGVVIAVLQVAIVRIVSACERIGLGFIARAHGWRASASLRRCITGYASIGWAVGLAGVTVAWVLTCVKLELSNRIDSGGLGPGSTSHMQLWWWAWLSAALIIPLFLFEFLCYVGVRRCRFANQPRIRSAVPGAAFSTTATGQASDARA